jgi:hypothetical protein
MRLSDIHLRILGVFLVVLCFAVLFCYSLLSILCPKNYREELGVVPPTSLKGRVLQITSSEIPQSISSVAYRNAYIKQVSVYVNEINVHFINTCKWVGFYKDSKPGEVIMK